MRRIAILSIVLVLISLISFHSARADVAPPQPAPGAGIMAGDVTKVQMVSEDVLMTLKDDLTVDVVATFDLVNQGGEAESMDVRFPVGWDDWYYHVVRLSNFTASVDGKPAEITEVIEPCVCSSDLDVPWAHWHVDFPPGQTVKVGVGYQMETIGVAYGGGPFGSYTYILNTGAAWYGKIGEGTVTFRLPYEANGYTVSLEHEFATSPDWYTVSGTDVIWHFTDLEPNQHDNIYIVALAPPIWRTILDAQAQAQQEPDSLDATLYLARKLRQAIFIDLKGVIYIGRTRDIEHQTIAAYEHALELAPNSIGVHVEYVQFLFSASLYARWYSESAAKLHPALEAALALAPDDPDLLEIQTVLDERPWDYELPLPPSTDTPTPTETASPTVSSAPTKTPPAATEIAEVAATETPLPEITEPSPTPATGSSGGCFGAGALVLIPLGLMILRRRM